MARKYTISSLQQTLFGPQAFNYFKTATESRSMSGWDFDGGGDLNSFDLSIYEISLMLYEEYEERKAHAQNALAKIDEAEIEVTGGTKFKLTDMTVSELSDFFNDLNTGLSNRNKIKTVKGAKGFTKKIGGKDVPVSINPRTTLNYKSILLFRTNSGASGIQSALEKAATKGTRRRPGSPAFTVTCAAKGVNAERIANASSISSAILDIINFYMVGNVNANRAGIVTFTDPLLLSDADAEYFPVFVDPTLRQSQNTFNLYDLFLSSRAYYGIDILNYSNDKNYKENFLFKSSDLYLGQKDKVIKYASGLYEVQDTYNANPNGPVDSLGIKSYTNELASLENIPIPPAHASYRTEGIDGLVVSPEYNVGADGLATQFYAPFDIAFFRNNLENILKPSVRDAAIKIVQKILDKYPPKTNPLPNFPFTTAANIDFADKVISDIISAICDGNEKYFTESRSNGGKYGISFGGTLTLSQFKALTATQSAGPRYYSDKEIIQRPVWKLIKCHSNEVYYVRANEFYDYSLSGLYHLSNINNTNQPLPENENLFLNQRFPNGEIAGIYMLDNFTDDYIQNDYTNNYFRKGYPEFSRDWNSISGNVKGYLYNQQSPQVPTGCYKVYLGILPNDPNLILNYTSLPHYWKHGDCSKPPCVPPPPTPSPTRTPRPTRTPTQTMSQTKSQTPTQTPSETQTQTQTQTPSVTSTSTQTETPTQTPTQTPSATSTQTQTQTSTETQTQTQTVTKTPTQTPSPTASVTKTQTQTQSITASSTRTPTQTQTPSSSHTPTSTPSETPTATSTQTQTQTPTKTQTQTQTATKTQTQTQTPSPTVTPSPSTTKYIPPTQTPSPTATTTSSTTQTLTASPTPSTTQTNSPTASQTQTPSNTPTTTLTLTATTTKTLTATPSTTETRTPTGTQTQTASYTATQTPSHTQTPSNTPTQTPSNTQTPTTTQTLSATPTSTQTPSKTITGTPTRTPSQTKTPTGTQTPSTTQTRTQTPTGTQTPTHTKTPSQTRTPSTTKTQSATQTQTASHTPSQTPTPSEAKECQLDFIMET